ncbi:MAG: DNA polymerase, partial [Bacillota bacterium]|nr:DNA polymerase [Bacillota bacterium]
MSSLIIIDGNSLINRAYYAIQKPMITADGFYTQGIYGFLSMLYKIQNDYKPTHMLVAFDRKAPTFRHLEFKEYKAGRNKMPEELAMEMPVLKEVLDAMGIFRYEEDGWEADDIIGTTAKLAEAANIDAYIITGDRDALQLATDTTRVIYTKRGISEFKLYDDAAMQEEYGFDHIQFIDYKGLRGDTSDNIPGIAGVGDKTATKLIQQFGSIENMLQHTDEIESAKLREKIEDGAMQAMMSKRLATIVTNIPVEYTIDDLKLKKQDTKKLRELFTRLEFKKYLKTLPQEEIEVKELELVYGTESLISNLKGSIWIDIVSNNAHVEKPSIECVQICKDNTVYLTTDLDINVFSGANLKLSGYNLKNVYYILESYGIDTSKMETEFDIAIAQYLLNPNAKAEELVFDDGPKQQSMFATVLDTFGECSKKFATFIALKEDLIKEIKKEKLDKVLYDIELPLCKILASMECEGIKLDIDVLNSIGVDLKKKATKLEKSIYKLAGEEFNINSPKQLGIVLFEKLQLPGAKKTKTGYATNADVLN